MRVIDSCPGCKKNINFSNEYARFNTKLALSIVSDGRVSVEISVKEIMELTKIARIYPRHIFHVDPTIPIILATAQGVSFPIDGLHRIARAHQEKKETIQAFLLTEDETQKIIMKESQSSLM